MDKMDIAHDGRVTVEEFRQVRVRARVRVRVRVRVRFSVRV